MTPSRCAALAAAACSLIVASGIALAQARAKKPPAGKKKSRTGDIVDISPVRAELLVLESDGGHYFALRPEWKDGESSSGYSRVPADSEHVYFGDDKNLYRLRTWSFSYENRTSYTLWMWDPRARAELEFAGGKWLLKCGDREVELTDVTNRTSSRQLLTKAVFHMPLWKRDAYALARDDSAHYYYVDRLYANDAGFRVFSGPKGKLRELKMVDIARDSEGDIFATKEGSLRLVLNKDRNIQSSWVAGKRQVALTYVPVVNNLELIYGELGVYTSVALGTPCDHY